MNVRLEIKGSVSVDDFAFLPIKKTVVIDNESDEAINAKCALIAKQIAEEAVNFVKLSTVYTL